MNTVYVHDIIRANEHASSLLAGMLRLSSTEDYNSEYNLQYINQQSQSVLFWQNGDFYGLQ